ncbi:MAG: hypothetical protein J6K73_02075 [Clostridia bacterium]|nr:hypothetical protein [Clostridia bacterium]
MWIVFIFMWIIISFFLMFPYCDFLEKKEFIDVADEVSIYFFYDILSRLTLLGKIFFCVFTILVLPMLIVCIVVGLVEEKKIPIIFKREYKCDD